MSGASDRAEQIHASCVVIDRLDGGRTGLLIAGPSGAGKSTLALRLISLGGLLVSDDRTDLRRVGARLIASAPPPLRGCIEARGVGLLRIPFECEANATWMVELGAEPMTRLPNKRFTKILGIELPLTYAVESSRLAAALFVLARQGELLDSDATGPMIDKDAATPSRTARRS